MDVMGGKITISSKELR